MVCKNICLLYDVSHLTPPPGWPTSLLQQSSAAARVSSPESTPEAGPWKVILDPVYGVCGFVVLLHSSDRSPHSYFLYYVHTFPLYFIEFSVAMLSGNVYTIADIHRITSFTFAFLYGLCHPGICRRTIYE